VRPGGEIRYLQSSGEVVTDAQGQAVRMLGICQDVTDRRQAKSRCARPSKATAW